MSAIQPGNEVWFHDHAPDVACSPACYHHDTGPISVVNEHAFFIRDHGVLHQVDPLTKPHRDNPTVLVRAQKHGTIMRVPVSDLIRDY